MKSVHIVGGDYLVAEMFNKNGFELMPDPKGADLLCFTGGADVSPDLYGDHQHRTTHINRDRDLREKAIFDQYRDVPKVGICRGGQFLNVMSGGTLWQDVDAHAIGHTHELYYLKDRHWDFKKVNRETWMHYQELGADYKNIEVTSTHHQMMRPDRTSAEVWGLVFRSSYRDRGTDNKRRSDFIAYPDVEIARYPITKSLCFQPHPEYGVKSCEDLFFDCLARAF